MLGLVVVGMVCLCNCVEEDLENFTILQEQEAQECAICPFLLWSVMEAA